MLASLLLSPFSALLTVTGEDNSNISAEDIKAALRRVSLERKGVIVLCGSSLKNKGRRF
jgi:hypothetical protein